MNLSIPRDILADALKHIRSVVEARSTLPILATARLIADGDSLAVTTTNLDAWLTISLPVGLKEVGAVCVDFAALAEIAKRAPKGASLSVRWDEVEADKMVLATGNSRWRLVTMPADGFPAPVFTTIDIAMEIDAARLAAAIALCEPAVSDDETRYYLGGILVHEDPDADLSFAATDGHRLVHVAGDMPEGGGGLEARILPRGVIPAMRAVAAAADGGAVAMEFDDGGRVRLAGGNLVLTSKLVDGTYPDYRRIIPAEEAITATAAARADELSAAVARVRLMADPGESKGDRAITVTLRGGRKPGGAGGSIVLRAAGSSGDAEDKVDAEIEGVPARKPVTIGLNGGYFGEALAGFPGDALVTIAVGTPETPIRLRSDSMERTTMVIMPRRLFDEPAAEEDRGDCEGPIDES